jgi:hypothetical protein
MFIRDPESADVDGSIEAGAEHLILALGEPFDVAAGAVLKLV